MPAHLKAYVFIMVLSLAGFAFLRRIMTPGITSSEDLERQRRLWLLMTSLAFLSSNFWIYAVLCLFFVRAVARTEPSPLSLYVLLLFAVPPFTRVLPGLGPLEYIIPIFHERLLTIAILCPFAVALYATRESRPRGARLPDALVATYLLYLFACSAIQEPLQGSMRQIIFLTLDIGVVYYVASRALRTHEDYRRLITAFVTAMAIIALVALFETTKSWLVYESLSGPFGTRGAVYHTRGDLGLLRARSSMGHPITLGYNLGVSLMLLHALAGRFATQRRQWLLVGLLAVGMLVTFSRGPWVGTAAGLLYLILSGPGKGRRIGYAIGLGGLTVGLLSLTPFGKSLYGMLPFVGKVDSGSIVYRQQLWDVSMVVLKENLWLGDMQFLSHPLMETMRQGEGIIDIVNTYLQISLAYGLVGLALFAACLAAAWRCVRHRSEAVEPEAGDQVHVRRALRSALITVVVTIATVSSISLVPVTYWLVIGLCVGYSRLR